MKGINIDSVSTLKSKYDNNCIACFIEDRDKEGYIIDSKEYRIEAKELLKLIKGVEFTEEKKIKHTYLKVKQLK